MKTKLYKTDNLLSFDDSLIDFIENYESNEHLPEYKVAILGSDNTHYRTITVYGHEALEDLDDELTDWCMVNRLDNPPHAGFVAIYSESSDGDIF